MSLSPAAYQLLLVYTTYVIAAGSPGPSNMRIMGVAMHQGRKAGLMFASGVVTGSIFWGLMAATGVSAILTQFAEALIILKIFGGLYLLYLAFKAARAAMTSDEQIAAHNINGDASLSGGELYRRGLLLHLSNPKSILSWIALVTLSLGTNSSWPQMAAFLGGCITLSITIFCGYAIVFSTAPMLRLYREARRWIEGVLSAVFALAGIPLLLSR